MKINYWISILAGIIAGVWFFALYWFFNFSLNSPGWGYNYFYLSLILSLILPFIFCLQLFYDKVKTKIKKILCLFLFVIPMLFVGFGLLSLYWNHYVATHPDNFCNPEYQNCNANGY